MLFSTLEYKYEAFFMPFTLTTTNHLRAPLAAGFYSARISIWHATNRPTCQLFLTLFLKNAHNSVQALLNNCFSPQFQRYAHNFIFGDNCKPNVIERATYLRYLSVQEMPL